MNRLFIIDAMALAHRCYWAHKELKSSNDIFTGTAYGAAVFLSNLIKHQEPTHLVAVTDLGGKVFRHDIYDKYKANRKQKSPEFKLSLLPYFDLFKSLGINVLAFKGYEADDVIGTIVNKFKKQDLLKFIVSGDKDFMQLVDCNTFLYKPGKWPNAEVFTIEKVIEKIGLSPDQIIDYLSITGDTADNIPGVKGIGPKGAVNLLKSFKTLDNIYDNLLSINNDKISIKLKEDKDNAYLSKKLIEIKIDIPISLELDDIKLDKSCLESHNIKEFYRKYEFKSFWE